MVSQSPKVDTTWARAEACSTPSSAPCSWPAAGHWCALIFSLPIALYLETYLGDSAWGRYVRLSLDVLWGIPSIVYGAFGFTLMLAIGLRASLLAGIIVLALLELPIMVRAMDEVIRRMPVDLEQAALALGSTKLEVALRVVTRQMLPGIVTAILLAFGRGIGDAASVLVHRRLHGSHHDVAAAAHGLTAAGGVLPAGHALSLKCSGAATPPR